MAILFLADEHYGTHAGRVVYERLRTDFAFDFHECDWTPLENGPLDSRYELLVLHTIAGTGRAAPPGARASANLKAWFEAGRNALLLHGSSAAFWHWDWWRPIVGWRWVRADDPDGAAPSRHPTKPYAVKVAKCRHPLAARLRDMDLPADEIYIGLEQTGPTVTLMETTIEEGTFPQCYLRGTPWGGTIAGFLPGHDPAVVARPELAANVRALIDHLLNLGPEL
ncbi:MAG: ThuA domain-containing protein [Kiritimatiellae bacterium]|nr:ThuA domain-containing protein [Kiritimatiellia bacterium]